MNDEILNGRSMSAEAGADKWGLDHLLDHRQQRRLIEAALFASPAPLTIGQLRALLPDSADLDAILTELRQTYHGRGVCVVDVAGGVALRTAPDLTPYLQFERRVTRKLSRAALETLSIIAYHQPVSRAEIEDIRGVATSRGTLDALIEAGWVKPGGRRKAPGRPLIWVTTTAFLSHFDLGSLDDLPGVDDLKAAGLLQPSKDGRDWFGGQSGDDPQEDDPQGDVPQGDFPRGEGG